MGGSLVFFSSDRVSLLYGYEYINMPCSPSLSEVCWFFESPPQPPLHSGHFTSSLQLAYLCISSAGVNSAPHSGPAQINFSIRFSILDSVNQSSPIKTNNQINPLHNSQCVSSPHQRNTTVARTSRKSTWLLVPSHDTLTTPITTTAMEDMDDRLTPLSLEPRDLLAGNISLHE